MRERNKKHRRRPRPSFIAPIPEPEIINPNRPAWLQKSLHNIELVFFDFETTGGNPQNSSITEIAAIKYINGQEVGRFQTLVNPERPIPRTVQKITGIDNNMVRNAPKIADVFDEFVAFIGGAVLISHGAIGDVAYISHHFKILKEATFQNFYICTHLLVSNFLSEIPSKTLSGVANYFGIPPIDVHRAMADAELTAAVFWKILDVCESHSFRTVEDLLKIQADNETLRRLGSGVLLQTVEDRAPSAPGLFYLFNPSREIVYMSAAANLKKRLLRITELGDEREFNRLITDVVDFKIERAPHLLGALLREKDELRKLSLPIDPRKFEGRTPHLIQVLIPEDLLYYTRNFSPETPHKISEHLPEKIDDVLPDPKVFGKGKSALFDEQELDENGEAGDENRANVPIRKTRRTVLGTSASKFKILRVPSKPNQTPLTLGALNSGVGWYFGPFDISRNPRRLFEELLTELPFHDDSHSIEARYNYLHLFVSALYDNLDGEIAAIDEARNSSRYFLRPLYKYKLSQIADRLRTLKEQKLFVPHPQRPRTGIAIITNSTLKEFDVYVVVRGTVRKEIRLPMEDSDKLRSSRFITRTFNEYHQELEHPLQPLVFTEDVCSDIELFNYWLQNRKGEGEWLDFDELSPLYDPEVL